MDRQAIEQKLATAQDNIRRAETTLLRLQGYAQALKDVLADEPPKAEDAA